MTKEADRALAEALKRVHFAEAQHKQTLVLNDLFFLDKIPAIGELNLRLLQISNTQIRDLSPISNLRGLEVLSFHNTPISDLRPISKLMSLVSINAKNSLVRDISPLADLINLRVIDLENTKVSDLAPLANLHFLESLNIRGTEVSELTPLAGLSSLANAAMSGKSEGLNYAGAPIADPYLKQLASRWSSTRTTQTIDYLRKNAGLDSVEPRVADVREIREPPELPTQGSGPHFEIKNTGVVSFARPSAIDVAGNHLERLVALHQTIQEAAQDLVNGLVPRSNQFPRVLTIAEKYLQQVNRDVDQIDFAVLYGVGLRLEITADAARRDTDQNMMPSLEDADYEALNSLLLLHGPFMLASAQGQALIADAERYQVTQSKITQLRTDALAFASAIESRPDIVAPDAAEFITSSAESIGLGTHPERPVTLTLHGIANLIVTVGELAVASLILGTPGLVAVGAAWALMRNNPEANEALQVAESLYAKTHEATVSALRNKVAIFLLDQQRYLRSLAGASKRLSFVPRLLDWLQDQVDQGN